MPRVDLA